ncbi:MAG: hypothetical protein WEE89_19595 [Gemmatimonadota bacterium]
MKALTLLVLAASLAACDRRADPTYVSRDSAGITLIQGDAKDRWELADSPSLIIGDVEGDSSYVFHQIIAALFLPSGSVVVADQGSKSLRIYSNGQLERTLGRPGNGPFEFRRVDVASVLGDSVMVYDSDQSRVSIWAVNGTPIREARIDPGIAVEAINGRGRLLGITTVHMSEYRSPGTIENPATVIRLGRNGEVEDSLVVLPYSERLVRTDGRSTAAFALPFGRFGMLVASEDGFCYSYGYVVEVRCFGETGHPTTITRVTTTPREISADQKTDFAEWFSSFVMDSAGRAVVRKRFIEQWSYPKYSPAVASLMVDRLGCIWLEEYKRPRLGSDDWYSKEAQGTGHWLVLDKRKAPVARVVTPAAFAPTDIGRDIMIGIWRDEVGVQTIRAFQLARSDLAAKAGYCA